MIGSSGAISSRGDTTCGERFATLACTFSEPRLRRKVSNHLKPRSKAAIRKNLSPALISHSPHFTSLLEGDEGFHSLYYSAQTSAKRYDVLYSQYEYPHPLFCF